MSSRKAECYAAVFNFIDEKIFKLEPSSIMTDWEAGMRKALRSCYPNAMLRGCWYHYCAAIRKKCLTLGLHGTLQSCANARFIKQQIMSLPLLPTEHFECGYAYIKSMAKNMNLTSTFEPLFEYFDRYWIGQVKSFHIFTKLKTFTSMRIRVL